MLVKLNWENLSDLSVTSGGLAVGAAAVCTMGDRRPHQPRGPQFLETVSGAPRLHGYPASRIPSFIEFSCFGFFSLKNICCWFSLVLKSCRVEMLTCFHLSVPLTQSFLQSFLFFSVLVPPAVWLSERCTHRPGWGPDLILNAVLICQADVY